METVDTRAPLVPGPPMTLRRTLQVARDPFTLIDACTHTYGETYSIGGTLGIDVITSNLDAARAVFSADPDTFEPFGAEISHPLIGTHSILLQSGNRHRAQRKLLMPPFHGARMRAYGEMIRDTTLRVGQSWQPGDVLNITEVMQFISLEVIIRAIFGVTAPQRVEAFRLGIRKVVNTYSSPLAFFPFLRQRLGGLGPWARFQDAHSHLTTLIYDEMDRRSQTPPGEDILSLLMQMTYEDGSHLAKDEIRDHLITLLFAGHETTAVTLSWALDQLARHPEVSARLVEEIAALGPNPSPEMITSLPYLEAICHESLRLFPVLPVVPRRTRVDFDMAGLLVPKGRSVGVSIWSIHRRPELYPEPNVWRPERFLERSYGPNEFLPFGGGNRRCIGAAFALYEMKIVLATLVTHHPLQVTSPSPPRSIRTGVTMGPERVIKMKVERR